jgi:hypothetical protein
MALSSVETRLQVNSHWIMRYLQRLLIGAANILNECVDLVRPHQVDRQMFRGGALEHWIQRRPMYARLHGETAEVAWAGVRQCAHSGIPAMLDKRLREGAFVNEQTASRDKRAIPSHGAVSR